MSRETKVQAIPDIRDDNVTEVLRAIKNVLQVREGHLGDPLDQNVTLRDLTDLNLLRNGGVTVFNNGDRVPVRVPEVEDDGYNPNTDYTTPAIPTGLTANPTFTNVYLSWTGAPYRNHAYTEIWRASTNNLGVAALVGTSTTNVYADAAQEGQTYYYWIRFVSVANVIGPYNSTNGTAATTATSPAVLLNVLTGQITESQLYASLGSRIDLIDAASSVAGSVNQRISVVQGQVNDLLNTPAYSNTVTYAANSSVTYNGSLYRALQTTTGNLPTNTTYWEKIGEYASLGDAVAAHTLEINNLTTGLGQEVTDRSLLASQMRGAYSGSDLSQVTSGLLYDERTARSSADSALSSSISSLSSTVTNNYNTLNSAITNEQTARSTADSSLASSIYTLQSTASGMDVIRSWNFDSTTEGFAATNASISWSGGSLRINSSNSDPMLYTPSLGIDGSKGYLIRMRIKRLAGSAWDGKIYYTTAGHGESETYRIQISDGTVTNEWRVLEWDMSTLADWTSSTIAGLRIDLGGSASDQFLIDWISISRVAPMPLASQATLQTDYYTKTATDSAIASATQSLVSTTTLNSTLSSYVTSSYLTTNYYTKTSTDSAISSATQSLVSNTSLSNTLSSYVTTATLTSNYYTKTATDSAISSANTTLSASIAGTYATSVSVQQNYYAKASGQSLEGQYTVKIDSNGYVTGFGLASTATNGTPTSSFIVRADSFSISNPSGPSISPATPFIVRTTGTTINGEYVAPGVYITDAFIQNGTITSAKIGSLTADKITTGTLTAAIGINTGYIYGGVNPAGGQSLGSSNFGTGYFLGYYQSANQFFIGSPTQNLVWNGTSLNVKGVINALAGYIGQNIIDSTGISSPNYVSGSSGWSVNKDGGAEFNNVSVRGQITGGAINSYYWPLPGAGRGFYLGPSGLMIGNYNDGKYFQYDQATGSVEFSGNLMAANGTFSGTLTANAINAVQTINIVNNAVTLVSSYSTTYQPGYYQYVNTSNTTPITVNMSTAGTYTVIATVQQYGTFDPNYSSTTVSITGGQSFSGGGYLAAIPATLMSTATVSAGTYTLNMSWSANSVYNPGYGLTVTILRTFK